MNYETDIAQNAYEFFRVMRDTIRREGMDGKRYQMITGRIEIITEAIRNGAPTELNEVRSMGMALIQRQRIM